jgi:dipeptidyl-peptidase III
MPQTHFAILKCLLRDGNGFMKVELEPSSDTLKVRIDRARIASDGKSALGKMLLHLHMYRSTANVAACRTYYESLSRVDGEYVGWRKAVIAQQQPKWLFVQANTWAEDGTVIIKEYPPTKEGVIQSWAERKV